MLRCRGEVLKASSLPFDHEASQCPVTKTNRTHNFPPDNGAGDEQPTAHTVLCVPKNRKILYMLCGVILNLKGEICLKGMNSLRCLFILREMKAN